MKNTDEIANYLFLLEEKGFKFTDDMIAFIYFGKKYTDASEQLVRTAIEMTLIIQREFDGSYFLSLLETLVGENIQNRKQALHLLGKMNILK
ncbi:hypothetical protein J2S13_000020 [Oikeobacillus pervagus]|uniref:Uncharacterized protein n=1 Tax=Oikeobacillus pervagus TaxID=1325931 RepID=A0AAJ1SYE1_9BACI|nr:DUF6123 family protein [Oikeobacillus pervagus]MDQ0213626.1 hypothetical protein [Oikeobacillus pervagus]